MTKNSNSKKNISKLELIGYLFAFFSFMMAIYTFFLCKENEIRKQSIFWFFGSFAAASISYIDQFKVGDIELKLQQQKEQIVNEVGDKLQELIRDKLSLVDLLEDSITEEHRKTRDDQNRKYLEWLNSLPEDKKLATQKMNTIFQLTQRSLRVSDFKKMLAKASLYQGNTENEEFDRELTKAIEEFQNKYGLSPDGTCGQITLSKLSKVVRG
jgi:murein L,D-transpeptidase YcbB/YkuD